MEGSIDTSKFSTMEGSIDAVKVLTYKLNIFGNICKHKWSIRRARHIKVLGFNSSTM